MGKDLPRAFGRYELLERLAVGGMAEIYRARLRTTSSISKLLVVKKILPHYARDAEFLAMFRDEAKVILRLSHANVVPVFDFGQEEGEWFLAMEYVHGHDLARVLRALAAKGVSALPPPLALYIAAEIAKGLHHAHTRKDDEGRPLGIVHRDVSPHNVLVSFEGEVKVTDFGVAKARDRSAEKTQTGVLKGKLAYMPPEQATGGEVDARTDVYAVGATLWEMLAGRRMLEGNAELKLYEAITSADPFPAPSSVRAGIPPEVDALVARAVAKNAAQRFPTAAELARAATRLSSAAGVGATEIEELMSFALGDGPRPAFLLPDEADPEITETGTARAASAAPESPRAIDVPTEPRNAPVPRAPAREVTDGAPRPGSAAFELEPEIPLDDEPRATAALRGHYADARTFLARAYQVHEGKRGMFLATEENEVVVGIPLVLALTFERPAARFTLVAQTLQRHGRPDPGVSLLFLDGELAELYDYLGFPD